MDGPDKELTDEAIRAVGPPYMDVCCDDRDYVRCGGTGVARLVRTRLAADLRPGSMSKLTSHRSLKRHRAKSDRC